MENISIITISDIHFNKNEAENQGLVISEFFNDLKGELEIFIQATYIA